MTRTFSTLATSTLAASLVTIGLASGCVINGSGDTGSNDDAGDESSGDDDGSASSSPSTSASGSATTADSGDDSNDDSNDDASSITLTDATSITTAESDDGSEADAGDETDSGADADPQEGPWVYDETGQTTNDCTFLANPSNGFGVYLVALAGPGVFTITPEDGTAPFECDYGGGSFDCPERLQEDVELDPGAGFDAVAHVYVGVSGTLPSSTQMDGEQQGRVECEGGDCGLAAQYLGTSFPCEFTIPFVGTAQ